MIRLVRVERLSNAEIALRLDRGIHAIETAVSRFAVRTVNADAKERRCMPCGKSFMSLHAGNRICVMCVRVHDLECA